MNLLCSPRKVFGAALMPVLAAGFTLAARAEPAGERYAAEVPDTLDLAERAECALHALTWSLDPANNYEINIPSLMNGGLACLTPKFAEALPMMRVMSGSDLNMDIEKKMMNSLVSMIGSDGLFYCPADRPWRKAGRGYEPADEPYASVFGNARFILAMMAWHERDHDPAWLERIGKMADGLARIAIDKGDYAYYPEGKVGFEFSYLKKSGWKYKEEPGGEREGAEGSVLCYQGNQIRALAERYAMSGNERALATAGKLVRFVLKPKFWEKDARDVVGAERAQWTGHFHGRMIAIRGLLAYAEVTNNARLKEFVRAAYECGRNTGLARVGYFPTFVATGMVNDTICEGCAVADMVALAVRLSDLGVGDYWDDVDGIVRNHLVEQQNVNREILGKALGKDPLDKDGGYGSFAAFATLTALAPGQYANYPPEKPVTFYAPCCTPNGSLALYYAWEGIIRHKEGVSQVNLLLNRASPWLDLDSYLPYEGKVVIRNKTAQRVVVRIPGWVERKAVLCRLNGKVAVPFWVDRSLVFDMLNPKDVVTIEFPVTEETVTYTIAKGNDRGFPSNPNAMVPDAKPRSYQCRFKGNTLIDIAPRDEGAAYPIYQRDFYKRAKAPLKTVTRYVSPHIIRWH